MADQNSDGQTERNSSHDAHDQLPAVPSPSLSPGADEAAEAAPSEAAAPVNKNALIIMPAIDDIHAPPKDVGPTPRKDGRMLAAALVAFAAGIGAIVGAFAASAWSTPPAQNVTALEERKAMQKTIAHLTKQVTTLRADLEKANRAGHTQVAKTSERINPAPSDITGSITKPQEPVTKSQEAATKPAAAPVPIPHPAPRVAMIERRPPVLADWSIHDSRGGFIYVEGHGGDIYQVVPGAKLPGAGLVRAVERRDGRWIVITASGLIVAPQDRRLFE